MMRCRIDAVRDVVEASARLGIGVLTLYSFSSDNWQRPPAEVNALMSLFRGKAIHQNLAMTGETLPNCGNCQAKKALPPKKDFPCLPRR